MENTQLPGQADSVLEDERGKISAAKPNKQNTRNPFKKICNWYKDLSKKQKILFVVVCVIALGGIGTGVALALRSPAPKPVPVVKKQEPKKEAPKPTTEASRLTGVQVDPAINKRQVIGVMIENSPDARPQSGLTSAGIVFEAIAEGGITRFLALYQDTQPDYIGPVRSARPYYVDWVQGFDAPLAHAGGSGDALAKIKNDKVKDLNHAEKYFNRVKSRYAPHNLYTSMAQLDAYAASKGFSGSTFDSIARKADKALATPTAKSIDLNISGFYYNPHYDYDAATNSYKRSMQGKPHTDEKSGAQIAPKVVVANVMQFSIIDRDGHSGYNTVGSGKTYIFQDGGVTEGTWEKTSSKAQMTFKDANGAAITLNPGQTWITAVAGADRVKYTP